MKKLVIGLVALTTIVLLSAGGCGGDDNSHKNSNAENTQGDKAIEQLIANDPAHFMDYSPTRKTINFWIDTWKVPGQLAFTYVLTGNPATDGYYVLDGPPVNYCTALTKTWTYEWKGRDTGYVKVPRRGIDGAYYSGSGCNSVYGRDASTGVYIELSVGQGQNYFLSTQPLPKVSTKSLGPTDASQVVCSGNRDDNLKSGTPDCKVK